MARLLGLGIKEINLIHVFVIGVVLMYIGKKKNESNKFAFYLLGLLALSIPFMVHLPKKIGFNYWTAIAYSHYLLFLPWFLYLSYTQNIKNEEGDNLFITGLVISVYHLYKALTRYKFL